VDRVPGRSKSPSSGIPSEKIVANGRSSTAGFHERDAGEQAPVQAVMVGDRQKVLGKFQKRAVRLAEEIFEAAKPTVVIIDTLRLPDWLGKVRRGWNREKPRTDDQLSQCIAPPEKALVRGSGGAWLVDHKRQSSYYTT
jgi:hypothetical protein